MITYSIYCSNSCHQAFFVWACARKTSRAGDTKLLNQRQRLKRSLPRAVGFCFQISPLNNWSSRQAFVLYTRCLIASFHPKTEKQYWEGLRNIQHYYQTTAVLTFSVLLWKCSPGKFHIHCDVQCPSDFIVLIVGHALSLLLDLCPWPCDLVPVDVHLRSNKEIISRAFMLPWRMAGWPVNL